MSPHADLVARLLAHLREVRGSVGGESSRADASTRFADAIDSMGFVEFLALVADDCGVQAEVIERAAGYRYGTVEELAAALDAAGLRFGAQIPSEAAATQVPASRPKAWLAATAAGLPSRKQLASEIDALLRRPPGWLEDHAGIHARSVWGDEDVLNAAARTADACLCKAGLSTDALGALLVTSEAPPILAGLAAALHQRLRLPPSVAALEIGGACTGFLAALWTAQRLLVDSVAVLVVAIEAPSRWLAIEPGAAGEAAALFGDAAAACVLTSHPANPSAGVLRDIALGSDGTGASMLRVQYEPGRSVTLGMNGVPLAQRAVRTMADAVRQMSARHRLTPDRLAAVVAHGGNGRMPALLARRLALPAERVWSTTAQTGNLGSASLPVAWADHGEPLQHPVIWTAVGAGLHWGAALFDGPMRQPTRG